MAEYRLLYEQNDLPIFQNRMYSTREAARSCPVGDVQLVQDLHTGLVFNASFRQEIMEYDQSYQNEQAHSPTFISHLNVVADIVQRHLGSNHLVEVGCGKATFLELVQARGGSITGFDPTYEGTNPSVYRHSFEPGVELPSSALILRHVLEHVQCPVDFLTQLRDANGGGLIYLEVPCLEWIMNKRAWFDIFYEHVNYFRLADFDRIFGHIIDSGHLFNGQYLYVVADLSSLRPVLEPINSPLSFPVDFLASLYASKEPASTGLAAVWGAASKGVIFSLLRERLGNPVDLLIDINPDKVGRFVPGTGKQVMSPEQGLSCLARDAVIYVMNPNYLKEIEDMTGGNFNLIGV